MPLSQEIIEEIYESIKSYDTIIIHRHVRPDPDALGSQLGLKYLITSNFPDKKVYAVGSNSQNLKWLGEMDKVEKEQYEQALVIVCDTANQERIDGKYYNLGEKLIKIDHHPMVDNYGDIQFVEPERSSTSEMIAWISKQLDERLIMNKIAAQLLYAGIVGDTGRFMFASTKSETFYITSWLTQQDINIFEINDRFNTLTMNQAKFQGHVLNHLNFTEHGVAYVVISREDMQTFGVTEEETNSIVPLPGQIEGILAWVVFVQQEGDKLNWRARVRSKGPIINVVAQKYHGGGHSMASGANAYSQEELDALVNDLNQVTIEYKKNKGKD